MIAGTEERHVGGNHAMDDALFLNKTVITTGWEALGGCSISEPTQKRTGVTTSDLSRC